MVGPSVPIYGSTGVVEALTVEPLPICTGDAPPLEVLRAGTPASASDSAERRRREGWELSQKIDANIWLAAKILIIGAETPAEPDALGCTAARVVQQLP